MNPDKSNNLKPSVGVGFPNLAPAAQQEPCQTKIPCKQQHKRTLKGTFGHLNSQIHHGRFFTFGTNRTISAESSDGRLRRHHDVTGAAVEDDIIDDLDDSADIQFNSSSCSSDKLKDSGVEVEAEASFSSNSNNNDIASSSYGIGESAGDDRDYSLMQINSSIIESHSQKSQIPSHSKDNDNDNVLPVPSGCRNNTEGTLIDKSLVHFGQDEDSSTTATTTTSPHHHQHHHHHFQDSNQEMTVIEKEKDVKVPAGNESSPTSSVSPRKDKSLSQYRILPRFLSRKDTGSSSREEEDSSDPAVLLSPRSIDFRNPYTTYTNVPGFGTNEWRKHVGGSGNRIGTVRKGITGAVPGANDNNNGNTRKNSAGATISSSNTNNSTITQHYYPEGGWGYVVLCTAFISHLLLYGFVLSSGIVIFHTMQLFHYEGSQEKIGVLHAVWIGTLSTGISLFLSPIWTAICKRKSTRLAAIFGALVTSLGCLFASFASQFHQIVFSYSIFIGTGVGLTRDAASLMVGQYFKRKREKVEIILVSASGIGIAVMSLYLHFGISSLSWRLGLQAITGTLFCTFFLSSCYRSASLYHPQRRAILHLKNQKRKIKEKEKRDDKPPLLDFTCLRSKTLQILMVSTAITSFGLYSPLFYLAANLIEARSFGNGDFDEFPNSPVIFQAAIGIFWSLGCILFGLMILQRNQECHVSKQYFCQMSSAICGISILALAAVEGFNGLVIFACIYGFSLGSYNYVLKVYTYERVRARHFPRAWSFVQSAQALPLVTGVSLSGVLNDRVGWKSGYYLSAIFVFLGSAFLFMTDLRKKSIVRRKATNSSVKTAETTEMAQSPTLRQLSFRYPNPQASSPSSKVEVSAHSQSEANEGDEEEIVLDDKELTCISEEGIADMDFQDIYYDDWDELEYFGECITSCNRVEVEDCFLSEFDPEHPMLQGRRHVHPQSDRVRSNLKNSGEVRSGGIVSALAIAGGIAGLSIQPTIPEENATVSCTEDDTSAIEKSC